jgi:5'-3' exonuclease
MREQTAAYRRRSMQVHLVDGTYELFRCFHGAPRATNHLGEEVGAGRAVLATFAALLAEPGTTHVAVAFDSLLAPADKAKDPIGVQVPLAVDVVRALGLVVWPSGRFSADELLASGARRYRGDPGVERVVLCTTDLDNAQCVRADRVVLLDRSRRRVTDEAAVRERFGVGPEQLPDLFALVGDRSDGIAGIPGWGVKSAAAVVARYGRLDDVPDDPGDWPASIRGRDRLAAVLAARRREAEHARDLLVLRDDAPLPYAVTDLEWRGADRVAFGRLVERLGEPDLGERVTRFA